MEKISTLGTIKTKLVMHNMISRRCIYPAAEVEDSLNTSRAFNSFQQHFFHHKGLKKIKICYDEFTKCK